MKLSLTFLSVTLLTAPIHAAECTPSSSVRLPVTMEIRLPASGAQGLLDDGYAIYSDGVQHVMANVFEAHNLFSCDTTTGKPCKRSLGIDLRSPVAPAPPLGLIRDLNSAFHTVWYLDVNRLMHSVQEIPVGQTVVSGRTELQFHLDGKVHLLVFGNGWAKGECSPTGSGGLVTGSATPAYIKRVSASEWTVVSSPGSLGKLFDYSDTAAPVEKGSYYLNFAVDVKLKTQGK